MASMFLNASVWMPLPPPLLTSFATSSPPRRRNLRNGSVVVGVAAIVDRLFSAPQQRCNHIQFMGIVCASATANHHDHGAVDATTTIATTTSSLEDRASKMTIAPRRSGNYKSSIWDFDFVESLLSSKNNQQSEKGTYGISIDEIKEHTKLLLKVDDPIGILELVDEIKRLGIGYIFDEEIKEVLDSVSSNNFIVKKMEKDIYSFSLYFRLLRQHGYNISSDAFNEFKDEKGNFKNNLRWDIKGMLSLYEASHLSFQGEKVLDEARNFTKQHLMSIDEENFSDQVLLKKVNHSLEFPLHWRMPRLEARWYIDNFEEKDDLMLVELAKYEFNVLQRVHQEDLKKMSRWWKDLGLSEQLEFSRSRLVECFIWAVGFASDPQYSLFREVLTAQNQLITTIDDIYDVYGSLEELQLFTDVVDKWNVGEIEHLPAYMKICFLAVHNTFNEVAYQALRDEGLNILPYLKKALSDLCRSYLTEAKWYHDGYTPSLEEYLENGWISISGGIILVNSYFSLRLKLPMEGLNLPNIENLIKWSSMIFRLWDDLATSSGENEKGDNPTSIQCYMQEAGVSEKDARKHIRYLIDEGWKKINEFSVNNPPCFQPFVNVCINVIRMSHFYYQDGDGFGFAGDEDKIRIKKILFEPIY